MTWKKIVICGSRGSGKKEFLQSLSNEIFYTIVPDNSLNQKDFGFALGELADYRAELILACERVIQLQYPLDSHVLYENSLFNSVAYSALRVSSIINDGTGENEEALVWTMTMHMCARMLRDTLDVDAIIYLPGNDGTKFGKDLEESLREVLEFVDKDKVFILSSKDLLQRTEEAAKIVKALNAEGTINQESPGEN